MKGTDGFISVVASQDKVEWQLVKIMARFLGIGDGQGTLNPKP